MCDINIQYIINNIKRNSEEISLNNESRFFQNKNIDKKEDDSSTLLHKIYLGLTNTKSFNLTEVIKTKMPVKKKTTQSTVSADEAEKITEQITQLTKQWSC